MLKQIQYFQAVVRCGSFTEAAEECFISQSAISQQIRALEEKLGVQLLERKNRKFSLTPAGEYFYTKSLVLLADFESIHRILVTSAKQQETERIHYQEILGIRGDSLYTESLEEAKLLAISGKGYIVVDGEDAAETTGNLCRIKLIRSGKPVKRNYCAFWKADNAGYYVEVFAEILKEYFA